MHDTDHRTHRPAVRPRATSTTPHRRRQHAHHVAAALVVLALALAACGAPTGPTGPNGPTTTTYLLHDNALTRSVSVMSSAGALAELSTEGDVYLGGDVQPCGMAIGPDGRLYVTDFEGARVVVIDVDSLLDGTGTGAARVATITIAGLQEPCGMAFDAAGSMWIADRRGSTLPNSFVANHLLQFDADAVAAATGTVSLSPIRTLQPVHHTEDVTPATLLESRWITWLGFDAQDRLWYTDIWRWSVNRIDEPSSYPSGLVTDVDPDMQLTNVPADGEQAAFTIMRNPSSLAFDGAGNVYVGTVGNAQALRYDVANLPSSGRTFVLPDATLTFPLSLEQSTIVGPRAVTLDAEGALWAAATSNQLLFRLTDPAARDGTVTPDVTTNWAGQGATVGASLVWTTRTTP